MLDEDLVEMNYKEYHESGEDVYPSLTVCLRQTYDQEISPLYDQTNEKLKKWDYNLTFRAYKSFLAGGCVFDAPKDQRKFDEDSDYCRELKRNEMR